MSSKMFTCPYNPVHVMKITRAHHHIVNCRKAHAHKKFIICSYNALHHYAPEDEAKHLETCSDRIALIDAAHVAYGMKSVVTGNLTMPPPAQIQFDDDDNWDSD
ncbi:gametocyte-specific factor 1-like [Daphnia pulicaria]|uniref:gametocyte-specific factor 1-like n=1 Tax=Daphnia pulicaria TaxID=35523 RepID=UPI001EECC161|nr:gametocyte-specific factor 1-like [Daphnia pulicaria]XP_046651103.1 gametocyte-specific factor 1-like [Daphnia pulicaria]